MSKKHHFVPRSLLKNFSVGGRHRQVIVFDKRKMSTYESSIENAGSENHFNTLVVDGQRICFEGVFKACDDELPRILRKVLSRTDLSVLSEEETHRLAYIIAVQMQRTLFTRKTFLDMNDLMKSAVERIVPASAASIPELSEDDAKVMALRALLNAQKWVPTLVKKDWSLNVATDGREFWTSDNPVVRVNNLPQGEGGLSSPGISISMPLSASCVLEMRCPSIANKVAELDRTLAAKMRSRPTVACTAENVLFYNSQQVLQSLRFLYGPSKEFAVARWILGEHPEARDPGRRLVEDGATSPRKYENMPEGRWLTAVGATTFHMLSLDSWRPDDGAVLAVVTDAWRAYLPALLADAPYSEVKVFEGQVARLTMSTAAIRVVCETDALLEVSHASAGIREAMRRSARRRTEPDTPGEA